MIVGDRIRAIREHKKLSQGTLADRTGLTCGYISRVENGHTVPLVETLERIARGLQMPMWQLLYEGEKPPKTPLPAALGRSGGREWGTSVKAARRWVRFCSALRRVDERHRQLLLHMARRMARR